MSNQPELRRILESALRAMGDDERALGPSPLRQACAFAASRVLGRDLEDDDWTQLWELILSDDENETARLQFGRFLRSWDNQRSSDWTSDTVSHTSDRRQRIYQLLDVPSARREVCDGLFPHARSRDEPIIIAREHEPWYTPERQSTRCFYWTEYRRYLREQSGWPDESVESLSDASRRIVERLSDPERPEVFPTRGLVVGYVQSGKTANFTAVVARAADAGYRLIIVLAGTLNILRRQTQRRMDKELIGQELLEQNIAQGEACEYSEDSDWDEFIRHEALPSQLGHFDWDRLTTSTDDYKRMNQAIRALQLHKRFKDRRANDPSNLHDSDARLIVIKKNETVLGRLINDLSRVKTALEEVPVLIIDDESDQASVNTKPPRAGETRERTAINRSVVSLLQLLPRAQYVGYTATPFANVFIDPADEADLFPRDYIYPLERPSGYMGVRDFFDLADDGGDLSEDERPEGFRSAERAFIRDIRGEDDEQAHLPSAIDMFVLAGAIKLYRKSRGELVSTTHHTMLVHRSTRQSKHQLDAQLTTEIFDGARYGRAESYERLEELLESDFRPVSSAQAPDLALPDDAQELRPFIDSCLSKVQSAARPVLVVNGDPRFADDNPSFDREPVWKILVGGTKLSRGYTVEGLTISYFRRKIGTADTLMQTGRWFGFRRGYRDLVRVFLGREEPGRGRTPAGLPRVVDLYESFKSICKDEETFRRELRRYVENAGERPITPLQIPPLVPSHLLRPTQPNKMFNAMIQFENYGGRWVERVLVPQKAARKRRNAGLTRKLLSSSQYRGCEEYAVNEQQSGSEVRWRGHTYQASPSDVITFLDAYEWYEGKPLLARVTAFLEGTGNDDPGIKRWILIVPERARDVMGIWSADDQDFRLIKRSRLEDGRSIKAFSERRHRIAARLVAGTHPELSAGNAFTRGLSQPGTAVMLIYPSVESNDEVRRDPPSRLDDIVNIGLGLQFPANQIQRVIQFGVEDPDRSEQATIERPEGRA